MERAYLLITARDLDAAAAKVGFRGAVTRRRND